MAVANAESLNRPLTFQEAYKKFLKFHITSDGKILDNSNKNISHTEGQGVALLFSAFANDKNNFDLILSFTKKMRRPDGLYSWKYENNAIGDVNNATDGDIYINWALLEAAEKFKNPAYRTQALDGIAAIRSNLIKTDTHGVILLPGVYGFTSPEKPTIINLSYWVFPALKRFSAADTNPLWEKLIDNGKSIIDYSYFGKYKLPPDWLTLSNPVKPTPDKGDNFGYDAIRVPLFTAWCYPKHPLVSRFVDYWEASNRNIPAFYNFKTEKAAPYSGGQGFSAIVDFVVSRSGHLVESTTKSSALPTNATVTGASYYEDSLVLLSLLARQAPCTE